MRALVSEQGRCVGAWSTLRSVKRRADTVRRFCFRFCFCVKDGMLRMWIPDFGEEGCEAEGELGWGVLAS